MKELTQLQSSFKTRGSKANFLSQSTAQKQHQLVRVIQMERQAWLTFNKEWTPLSKPMALKVVQSLVIQLQLYIRDLQKVALFMLIARMANLCSPATSTKQTVLTFTERTWPTFKTLYLKTHNTPLSFIMLIEMDTSLHLQLEWILIEWQWLQTTTSLIRIARVWFLQLTIKGLQEWLRSRWSQRLKGRMTT